MLRAIRFANAPGVYDRRTDTQRYSSHIVMICSILALSELVVSSWAWWQVILQILRIVLLDKFGLLQYIIPEITLMPKECDSQDTTSMMLGALHPSTCVLWIPPPIPPYVSATLLHDTLGKPVTYEQTSEGDGWPSMIAILLALAWRKKSQEASLSPQS